MIMRYFKFTALGLAAILALSSLPASAQNLDIPEDIFLEGLEAAQEPPPAPDPFAESQPLREPSSAGVPSVDSTPLVAPEPLDDSDSGPDIIFGDEGEAQIQDLLPTNMPRDMSRDFNGDMTITREDPADMIPADMPSQDALAPMKPIQSIDKKNAGGTSVSDTFFDSDEIPVAEKNFEDEFMNNEVPTNIKPSKVVIVKRSTKADTQKAKIVAASRAVELGRYGAALELYDELYKLNPREPNVLSGRAMALQKLGRFDEAILGYEELFDVDEGNIEAQINMLGLMSEKYPSVALRRLALLRDEQPDNVGIISQMAIAQARLGSYEDAMVSLGMAASMQPGNAGHIFNMAVISDRAGYHNEAMSYYEQALEIDSVYGGGRSIPRDSIYERLSALRN